MSGQGTDSLPEGLGISEVVLRSHAASVLGTFYEEVVGLRVDGVDDGVTLSAPGGEPLIRLRDAPDGRERGSEEAGLYHVAVRVPDRTALADALERIRASGRRLDGAADHLVSEALYLTDPEGNGIEIYADRPREEWEYTEDGEVWMPGEPLDLSALAAHASADPGDRIAPETDVGHVHLEVTDLDRSSAFYRDAIGFERRLRKRGADFLAGGEYHHHLAINTWQDRTRPIRTDSLGLESVEFVVPPGSFEALRDRLSTENVKSAERNGGVTVSDPDGISIVLTPGDG